MTLKVSEVDLTRLSSNMGDPTVQATCAMVAYTQLFLFSLVATILELLFFWAVGIKLDPLIKTLFLFGIVLSLGTMVVAWRWPLPGLIRWVVGKGRRSFIIARWILILAIAYSIANVGSQVVGGFYYVEGSEIRVYNLTAVLIATLLLSPVVSVLWIVSICVSTMLWPRRERWSFALTRATLWRVVEYEKGSLAAIVLAITVLLGLFKAVLELT
jgi:hypothetical protein